MEGKGERKRYTQLNAELQRISREDKKAFVNEQCKEIEKNNNGNTRYLFKKIGDTNGTFQTRMGMIKDKNLKGPKRSEEMARIHRRTI